ncbi:MAG: sulfurtransferase complex subunit TusB [Rhodospirillales bacterium]|jgi:tRNA 2-thiouridine synthesizing protein B|nr:sulfurtransferase complex subunit TusB [Rhodospirillales bacterium]|tara:strand:- start:211 stop:513 length:303 start_codon:yes stop_codon:yes gene_type:complete
MLHIVNKSPFERSALDSCLRVAPKGGAILLYEDGVYAACVETTVTDTLKAAAIEYSVFVLGPDLAARGIAPDRVIEGIEVVDYGGFVDLVEEHGPVQSWL